MSQGLSTNAQKVQNALQEKGVVCEVLELPSSTRTAVEAAETLGCDVAQIVKSLIFRGKQSNKPILVVASGANRVNEKKIGKMIGEKISRATPEFAREQTGYAIGGIPPVGHTTLIETYIDEDLLSLEEIWAAAGTPFSVFKLTPDDLKQITSGVVTTIT